MSHLATCFSERSLFKFSSSLAKPQWNPINLERRQISMWHKQMNEGIWWPVNKSSIARVQDEGPPLASCGGWPTVSDAPSSLNHFLSQSQRQQSLPERQRLMYRCLYLLSFQPLCQLVRDIKVISSLGETTQGPSSWGPPSQNQPQTKVTAASWEWDHYWKERRVFGVFSKNIHAGIPGCVIYFHPITSKSLDAGLPILRPLSFHTGLFWWKSLAWLIMQKALHKNSIFSPLFTAACKICRPFHMFKDGPEGLKQQRWRCCHSPLAGVGLVPIS